MNPELNTGASTGKDLVVREVTTVAASYDSTSFALWWAPLSYALHDHYECSTQTHMWNYVIPMHPRDEELWNIHNVTLRWEIKLCSKMQEVWSIQQPKNSSTVNTANCFLLLKENWCTGCASIYENCDIHQNQRHHSLRSSRVECYIWSVNAPCTHIISRILWLHPLLAQAFVLSRIFSAHPCPVSTPFASLNPQQ